jgi:HAMP domain-containing protein
LPNPRSLDQLQDSSPWLGTVILLGLVLIVAIVALVVARLMLEHWLQPPPEREARPTPSLTTERSGTAGGDARALFAWLWRWLSGHLRPLPRAAHTARPNHDVALADAWRAYRALLEWAAQRGLARGTAETTGELQSRLAASMPTLADDVALLTSTYDGERYGGIRPPAERLRRLAQAVSALQQQPHVGRSATAEIVAADAAPGNQPPSSSR